MIDPKKVLEVCGKAPAGPYHVGGEEGSMLNSYSTQLTGHRPDGHHYIMAQANHNFLEESEALIQFIVLARNALPELAREVIRLQEDNELLSIAASRVLEYCRQLQAVAEVAYNTCEELEGHGLYTINELRDALAAAGYGDADDD